jgi:hypothetical protein
VSELWETHRVFSADRRLSRIVVSDTRRTEYRYFGYGEPVEIEEPASDRALGPPPRSEGQTRTPDGGLCTSVSYADRVEGTCPKEVETFTSSSTTRP